MVFIKKGYSRFNMSLFYTDSENYFTLVIKCTKKEKEPKKVKVLRRRSTNYKVQYYPSSVFE